LTTKFCTTGGDKMGFFGGGGNSGAQEGRSASDELIDREFKKNQADIEAKKKSLYQQRLDIIKSQGNQDWHSKG
ncbi:MAG: hypothetical protein WA324_27895, partial [Bryobacteraceae bacterium]